MMKSNVAGKRGKRKSDTELDFLWHMSSEIQENRRYLCRRSANKRPTAIVSCYGIYERQDEGQNKEKAMCRSIIQGARSLVCRQGHACEYEKRAVRRLHRC